MAGTPGPAPQEVRVKRLARVITAALLGRAWAQKSTTWLKLAALFSLFRLVTRSSARRSKKHS
jgi:hypothetical protein